MTGVTLKLLVISHYCKVRSFDISVYVVQLLVFHFGALNSVNDCHIFVCVAKTL